MKLDRKGIDARVQTFIEDYDGDTWDIRDIVALLAVLDVAEKALVPYAEHEAMFGIEYFPEASSATFALSILRGESDLPDPTQ